MALKITKQIEDANGNVCSEIYTNIGKRYTYDKRIECLMTSPSYWENEQSYKDGETSIVLNNRIGDFTVKIQDASSQLLFDFLYIPFIAALIERYGLVQGELWSDKTGIWEQVTI